MRANYRKINFGFQNIFHCNGMSNQGDAGANGAEEIQQAEAGDNHNVNNGNVNIQEQGEGVMVNMFQAMNIPRLHFCI